MAEENVEGGRPVERPLWQAGQGVTMAPTWKSDSTDLEKCQSRSTFWGKKIYLLFLAVLGLCCCVWAFSSCGKGEPLSSFDARASFVVEHQLMGSRLQ